jgi:hypothetical protein
MARYQKPYWHWQSQGEYTIGPPVCVKCGRYLEFTEVRRRGLEVECSWTFPSNSSELGGGKKMVKRCANCDQRRKHA